jgi:hypothetical protein
MFYCDNYNYMVYTYLAHLNPLVANDEHDEQDP